MESKYRKICEAIKTSDAVLIGASNGLSISEGFNIFATDGWFQENLGDFQRKYGINSVLQGCFARFPTEEEKWGFWSRLVWRKSYDVTPSQMMLDLYRLVDGKDYFVLTSNGEDHFTPAGFAPERVFELEGQYTKMRCARHCHEDVYPNREAVERMAAAEKNGVVPTELLPKCPRCGGPMEIHLADSQSFFQRPWFAQKQSEYQSFLNRANGKKLVILEFGIGWRNQLIKAPLMQLTAAQPHALYVTFNKGELYIPDEIAGKSIGVDGDIATAIREIVRCDL